MVTLLLTHKAGDARAAMAAIVESRSLSIREDDPEYPKVVAKLAWAIPDAMAEEHMLRASGPRGKR